MLHVAAGQRLTLGRLILVDTLMEEAFERLGHVQTELRMMSHASIEVTLPFEVSLDCMSCRRRVRTVVFSSLGTAGRCTPTGHEFDGWLSELESRGGVLRAAFRFRYKPFIDAKYPDEARYRGFEAGAPSWARFNFTITCRGCGATTSSSTQTNLARPWVRFCDCGTALYEDVTPVALSWESCRPDALG
jgi:hypothetical protein